MDDATERLWRIGAGLYVVWGLLHIVVGAVPLVRYAGSGVASMLGFHGFDLVTVDGPMAHASHIIAEHSANLIGVGVLAVVVAVALVARGRPLGFWLNAALLGVVDLSFIVAELVPGHVPWSQGGIGPLLYVAALAVTTVALVRVRRTPQRAPSAAGPASPDRRSAQV